EWEWAHRKKFAEITGGGQASMFGLPEPDPRLLEKGIDPQCPAILGRGLGWPARFEEEISVEQAQKRILRPEPHRLGGFVQGLPGPAGPEKGGAEVGMGPGA